MPEPVSAVVVGSKGFLDAVEAPLRLRLGHAPHVAGNPQEVLLACGDGGRLFVLEYAGEPWIDLVRSLRVLRDRSLSIVAAVGPARADEAGGLKAAGADEVVSWDGRADPVLWAVDRVVGRGPGAAPASASGAPVPVAVITPAPAPRPAPPPLAATTPAAIAPVPGGASPGAPTAAPPLPATPPWTTAVPSAAEAEAALLAARCGNAGSTPARQAASERVLAALSELERAALVGGEVPVEAALLREAAALRLRVDVALAILPSATADDHPAAQVLVADVDAVLARLKAAADESGEAPALEPLRRALVDGGLALAAAVSRLRAADAPDAAPSPPSAPAAAPARVLSNESVVDAPARRTRAPLWVAFVVAALATGGYHLDRLVAQPPRAPQPRLGAAPANTLGARAGSGTLLVVEPGKPLDPAELDRFRAAEEARGNRVVEAAPGVYVSRPPSAPAPGANP